MIDLPDFSRLQDNKLYPGRGRTWKMMAAAIMALARGENIECKGGNIFKRPGSSSVALAARKTDLTSGGSSTDLTPLHGVDASVGGSAQVRVIFGTIAGIVPKLGGTTVLKPTGATPQPTLAISDTNTIVYAIVTFDPVSGNTVDIEADDGPGAPADSITNGIGTANIILFGVTVKTAAGSGKKSVIISQVVSSSLAAVACGPQVTFGRI